MIPYFLLVFFPLLLTRLGDTYRIRLGKKVLFESKTAVIDSFMFILFLMLAFRGQQCGSDTRQYIRMFEYYSRHDFIYILQSGDHEIGFRILTKLSSILANNSQVYLAITSLACVLPLWHFYRNESDNHPLTISIFMFFPTFLMCFSGIRQAIAISIGVLAWYAARSKSLVKFIALVIIAMQFHVSAFILFLLYPMYGAKVTKKWLLAIIPLMAFVFVFKKPIFNYALTLLWEEYDSTPETGATAILWLLILFAIYAYVIPDEQKLDQDIIGMRNILLLSIVIQFFAMLHPLSMRMNYFFLIFVPSLITKVAKRRKRRFAQVTNLSVIVMTVYFVYYFVMNVINDNDVLNIFPYIPFWRN